MYTTRLPGFGKRARATSITAEPLDRATSSMVEGCGSSAARQGLQTRKNAQCQATFPPAITSQSRMKRSSPPCPPGKPHGMVVLRHTSRRSPSRLARRPIADPRIPCTVHRYRILRPRNLQLLARPDRDAVRLVTPRSLQQKHWSVARQDDIRKRVPGLHKV